MEKRRISLMLEMPSSGFMPYLQTDICAEKAKYQIQRYTAASNLLEGKKESPIVSMAISTQWTEKWLKALEVYRTSLEDALECGCSVAIEDVKELQKYRIREFPFICNLEVQNFLRENYSVKEISKEEEDCYLQNIFLEEKVKQEKLSEDIFSYLQGTRELLPEVKGSEITREELETVLRETKVLLSGRADISYGYLFYQDATFLELLHQPGEIRVKEIEVLPYLQNRKNVSHYQLLCNLLKNGLWCVESLNQVCHVLYELVTLEEDENFLKDKIRREKRYGR